MESWLNEAERISSLEAEIGFVLQDDFYYGPDRLPDITERKFVEPLPSAQIRRRGPLMATTLEALDNLQPLAGYYYEIIRLARKHSRSFNAINHYFWLRFWLTNPAEDVTIGFPWYDTFSEIDAFLCEVAQDKEGQVFWDVDQCWELEVHSSDGELFARLTNPDHQETHALVRFPRDVLLQQIGPLRSRAETVIKHLTSAVGRDVWTNRIEWPEFLDRAERSASGQPWWKRWLAPGR